MKFLPLYIALLLCAGIIFFGGFVAGQGNSQSLIEKCDSGWQSSINAGNELYQSFQECRTVAEQCLNQTN